MKNIYQYSDYRLFLRDYYNEMKERAGLTFREFAARAGINAPATLLYVIHGKRSLSARSVMQYIRALGLKKREAEYFRNLVFYNQARTATKRERFLKALMRKRRIKNVFTVESDKYEFYSQWYHSVIRELVNIVDVKDNFLRLGRMVAPPISVSKTRRSIELLERLGLISKDENGIYRQTHAVIQTGPVQEHAVLQFQSMMLHRALESFGKLSKRDKMSSSTTFSISQKTFEHFKERIRDMRTELMDAAAADPNPERVYQLAVTLFPVSRERKGH